MLTDCLHLGRCGLLVALLAISCVGQGVARGTTPGVGSMDDAFYIALYELIQGKAAQAYERLDRALDKTEPTDNCYLYLPLYRTCFDLAMKSPIPLGHSKKAEARIRELQNKDEKSPADLVKLAVLLPVRERPVDIRPYLQAIVTRHPESPWTGWARWKKVETEASDAQSEVLKAGHSLGLLRLTRSLVSCEIVTFRPDESAIMQKWKIFVLCQTAWAYTRHAAECIEYSRDLEAAGALSGVKSPEVLSPDGVRPDWVRLERRLLEFLDTLCGSPKKIVWEFFEDLRKRGVVLPDEIPVDKQTFDKGVRQPVSKQGRS
ncbi:MAG TPA: hypothetical protein VM219_03415 [Phycisphaerae bacterium]|nr:hypothetical protein [Phycisphaerae bacterium]